MKKIVIPFLLAFTFTSCAANMQKTTIYINGKKQTFYKDNSTFSTTSNQIILYTSKNKNPNSKLVINNKLLVFIPKNTSIKEIEDKYNIKFMKFINKKLNLALFQTNIGNILEITNNLNKDGIKTSFNYSRKLNLY